MQVPDLEIQQQEPKTQTTTVVLTTDMIARLNTQAKRRVISRSYLVRCACESYLKALEAETSRD